MIILKLERVDYEILEREGFDGLLKWYETLGIETKEGQLDPTRVHTNGETYDKMQSALCKHYGIKHSDDTYVSLALQFMNIGVSGSHDEVPLNYYKVVTEC